MRGKFKKEAKREELLKEYEPDITAENFRLNLQ
jgi:hypothetical protein